jgi:hypothetical protein
VKTVLAVRLRTPMADRSARPDPSPT